MTRVFGESVAGALGLMARCDRRGFTAGVLRLGRGELVFWSTGGACGSLVVDFVIKKAWFGRFVRKNACRCVFVEDLLNNLTNFSDVVSFGWKKID